MILNNKIFRFDPDTYSWDQKDAKQVAIAVTEAGGGGGGGSATSANQESQIAIASSSDGKLNAIQAYNLSIEQKLITILQDVSKANRQNVQNSHLHMIAFIESTTEDCVAAYESWRGNNTGYFIFKMSTHYDTNVSKNVLVLLYLQGAI